MLQVLMAKRDLEYDPAEGETTARGVVLPAVMIGVGLLIRIILAFRGNTSAGAGIGLVFCQLILSLVVMLIGCFTASAWMNLNFGPADRTVLKLCAISLCAGAIGTFLASMGPRTNVGPNMSTVAWYAVVLCYLGFFALLFSHSIEIQEIFLTVCIVVVMQLAVSFALSQLLGIGHPMALFFTR